MEELSHIVAGDLDQRLDGGQGSEKRVALSKQKGSGVSDDSESFVYVNTPRRSNRTALQQPLLSTSSVSLKTLDVCLGY